MLNLEHIDLTFNRGTVDEMQLFNDFNLNVKEGEFVSIVGSNGSGKTTMLNLICGTLHPDSGHILLKGQDITNQKEHIRARRIGRVFQDPKASTCPSLTILENFALADRKGRSFNLTPAINRKRIDLYRTKLETCGMGLENRLHVPVGSLSGGQRQAVAMTIVGMMDIDLLILDEHTAALDPKSADTIMELTGRMAEVNKLTTLMVTHNLRYAVEYGSRLLMMHDGHAVMDCSGEEKTSTSITDLLDLFNSISIECGN